VAVVARGEEQARVLIGGPPGVALPLLVLVHPASADLVVGGPRRLKASVRMNVVVRKQGVAGVAPFLEDAVSELGPLVDEQLGGVAPLTPSVVPGGDELVRKDGDVTGLAATAALLSVRRVAVDGMPLAVDPDIRVAVRRVARRFPDHGLAFPVPPGRGDDDGGGLEVDPVVAGLEQSVGALGERFLEKT